jgi:hypothetical protein
LGCGGSARTGDKSETGCEGGEETKERETIHMKAKWTESRGGCKEKMWRICGLSSGISLNHGCSICLPSGGVEIEITTI